MIILEINNQTKDRLDNKFLNKIVRRAGKTLKIKDKRTVSLALVSSSVMKKLNKQYRKINQPTDVLSFGQSKSKLPRIKENQNYLGEIVICYTLAKKQAQKNKISFKEELARLLVHGLLHLTGHHHSTAAKRRKIGEITDKILDFDKK